MSSHPKLISIIPPRVKSFRSAAPKFAAEQAIASVRRFPVDRHSADIRRETAIRKTSRSIRTKNREDELASTGAAPEFRPRDSRPLLGLEEPEKRK